MAQKTAVVRASLTATGGASTDFTSSGFGTVSAALIFVSSANTTNNPQDGVSLSIGFWDGTNQRACQIQDFDNQATTASFRSSSDALGVVIDTSGSRLASFSVSNVTDGIRLTMVTDNTSTSYYCTVILLAGISAAAGTFTPAATQNSTQESASLGFAPDLVFFMTIGRLAAVDTRTTTGILSFGFAASDATHRAVGTLWRNGVATEELTQKYSENRCLTECGVGTVAWGLEVTTFGADTFTATTRDGATSSHICFYLALGGADLNYEVKTFDTRTTTGDTVLSTTLVPESLLAVFTTNASTTIATNSEANGLAFGLKDANGQFSHNVYAEDAADTTNNGSAAQAAAAIDLDSSASGTRTDLVSGTVTLNASDVTLSYTTVDATARKGFGIVFGPAPTGGNLPIFAHYYAQQE